MTIKTIIRTAIASVVTAGTLIGVSACGLGGDAASGSSDDTVNIGVIYPKTGQYAQYGKLLGLRTFSWR